MRARTIAIAILAVLVQSLGSVTPARAAEPVVRTFFPIGTEQFFDVPAGVASVHVVLVGGRGGAADGGAGGLAARVEGDLVVTSGTRLYVEVGGDGQATAETPNDGGFNGGGAGGHCTALEAYRAGGGGASDIRTVPRADAGTLASRVVVAGGGGGAGSFGEGGQAGAAGVGESAGGGGTTTSGGAGGGGDFPGAAGVLGLGGAGASAPNSCGSGGGGGVFGGGGGGASQVPFFGGPGGGGSSDVGGLTASTVDVSTHFPWITIAYVPPPDSGTVDAVVTMASSAVCLELSTSSVDFGTRLFGEVGAPASPLIGVTNCSGIGEVILARGADATGPGGAAWTLATSGACQVGTLGTDAYRLRLESQAVPDVFVNLGAENATLQALAPGATADHEAQMDTPCPGSSGAGAVMTLQVVFTAIEEVAP
jgi:hypothetical protein